jgi:hypothetical protein
VREPRSRTPPCAEGFFVGSPAVHRFVLGEASLWTNRAGGEALDQCELDRLGITGRGADKIDCREASLATANDGR